jgi:hypothetical protein
MSLKVADYPRSQYEVYWETVPNGGASTVRFYAWETGELVVEHEVVGGKDATHSFIEAQMAAFAR